MPPMTWRPAPSQMGSQQMTMPRVARPPRPTCFSSRQTEAPSRAAATAAATPAMPPPATTTS